MAITSASNLLANGTAANLNVIVMHSKFRRRSEDRYMFDMASALKENGHNVTLYTSEIERDSCIDIDEKNPINVTYCGNWLPKRQSFIKSLWMALNLIIFGPAKKPTVVLMDVHTVALYLLSVFTNYKLIYVTHFASLQNLNSYSNSIKIAPDLISAKALKRADYIVAQSDALADVFKRSFPNIKREVKILHPCVDTGNWRANVIDVTRLIPDLPKPHFLFVCFGAYRKRSNFKMVLEAFDSLITVCEPHIKSHVHLVIAGHCSESNLDQKIYYNELLEFTKMKAFASQVTFLKQLPILHKKTLIEESIGVIIPSKYELFPETILAVLAGSRPVISTNTGFAKEVLRHRITGILIEPSPQLFAAAMYKILANPAIQVFLSEMGNEVYHKSFTYGVFKRKLNGFLERLVEPPQIMNCL